MGEERDGSEVLCRRLASMGDSGLCKPRNGNEYGEEVGS